MFVYIYILPQVVSSVTFFAIVQLCSPLSGYSTSSLDLTKNEAKGRSREWGIKGRAQRILIELINFELAVKWRNEARYTVIYLPCDSWNSNLTSNPKGSLRDFQLYDTTYSMTRLFSAIVTVSSKLITTFEDSRVTNLDLILHW